MTESQREMLRWKLGELVCLIVAAIVAVPLLTGTWLLRKLDKERDNG